MDRLPALKLLAYAACGLIAACSSDANPPAPTMDRVEGVMAEAPRERDVDAFCDVRPDAAHLVSFEWPAVEGTPPPARGWRWINVWATWCHACVEELPRITAWPARLAQDGMPIDLVLLSVDDNRALVDRFAMTNPAATGSLRIEEPAGIKPFFVRHGLDEGAPIPVHIFVDPQNKVRCLRAGGVADEHYAVVRALIGASPTTR